MADKEEGQATAPQGADWEVVSLTASAYAAAHAVDTAEFKGEEKGDIVGRDKVETSDALFMSGHFVLPPSQHDNLPMEPENADILGGQGGEDDVSESAKELWGNPDAKEEENWDLMKLTESDNFHGIPFSDEKGNSLAISDADFAQSTTLSGLNLAGKEQSIYDSPKLHSLHSEATTGVFTRVLAESAQSSDPASGSNVPNLPKQTEKDSYDGSGLPYAAWWKKQAASLYAHATETSTFWSIFVAAAVMGIVILGQQWQHERWQALHHEWKSGINDERTGRIVVPVSGFKDVIIGSNQRDFSIRASASRDR